jgi:hypothetical protein
MAIEDSTTVGLKIPKGWSIIPTVVGTCLAKWQGLHAQGHCCSQIIKD